MVFMHSHQSDHLCLLVHLSFLLELAGKWQVLRDDIAVDVPDWGTSTLVL